MCNILVKEKLMSNLSDKMHKKFIKDVTPANTPPRKSELKQTRRRRQRKRHLKMQLRVSAIISQLFKVITLTKCVLTILELIEIGSNAPEVRRQNRIFGIICSTSSRQLQNETVHVVERTRTTMKCPKMKNARAKRAKLLFFSVKYVNL